MAHTTGETNRSHASLCKADSKAVHRKLRSERLFSLQPSTTGTSGLNHHTRYTPSCNTGAHQDRPYTEMNKSNYSNRKDDCTTEMKGVSYKHADSRDHSDLLNRNLPPSSFFFFFFKGDPNFFSRTIFFKKDHVPLAQIEAVHVFVRKQRTLVTEGQKDRGSGGATQEAATNN